MRKIFLLALTLPFLWVSCSPKRGITGTFIGLTNDTLWIEQRLLNDDDRFEFMRKDTVVVKNGKFFYQLQTTNLAELTIYPLENIQRSPNSNMIMSGPGATIILLYAPGDRILLDATNKDNIVAFQAKGNRYNEQLSTLNADSQDALKRRRDALKVISDRSFDGDKTLYQEQLREAMAVIRNNELNYIIKNKNEPLSAYLVASFYEESKVFQYVDSLGAEAKESLMGHVLATRIKAIHAHSLFREEAAIKERRQKEMIGKPAPEFTLKETNGNDFSLSSLRGKYVVLDFWGSWCSGCLEAFPRIKEYYASHPMEFEIVGINIKDTPEEWHATVKKRALPWINVIDDENDSVSEAYYVVAAPTYIILNKEGIMVDFPAFDGDVMMQLDELRKKMYL